MERFFRLAVASFVAVLPAVAQAASLEALRSRPFVLPPPAVLAVPELGASGEVFQGRVLEVLDGDTVVVSRASGSVRLRLSEVDAPEKTQPFGPEAKARLTQLVLGRDVEVRVKETDRYGRSVSWVFVGGTEVGRVLLREGLVWWYRAYSQDASLGEIEREAREARLGLWSQESPEAPWDYRRRQRASRPNDVENPLEVDPMEGHEDVGHAPYAVPAR